jgi:hypothetical protein
MPPETRDALTNQGRDSKVALDQIKIGTVVAEQMASLEVDYGDDCEIGDVCTIVEVVTPNGSAVRVRGSIENHAAIGLLRVAERLLLSGYGPGEYEKPEDSE